MSRGRSGLRLPDSRSGTSWGRPVFFGAVLLVIILGVFWLYGRVTGGGCADVYCDSGINATVPPGFTRESAVFRFNDQFAGTYDGQDVQLAMSLDGEVQAGSDLGFYQYDELSATWTYLGTALLDETGEGVTGTLAEAPLLVAVLRQTAATGQVIAYFNPALEGATLHPDASQRATIVHTLDYTLRDDGSLVGAPSTLTLEGRGTDPSGYLRWSGH